MTSTIAGSLPGMRRSPASQPNPSASRRGAATAGPKRSKLIDGLTLVVIIAVLCMMSGRPLLSAHEWNSRQSAIDATDRYLFRARAAALRASRNSWFIRDGNVVEVLLDSAGTAVRVAPPIDLGRRYGVAISMQSDTVAFDPRGFIRAGESAFVISNARGADTVCIGAGNAAAATCH